MKIFILEDKAQLVKDTDEPDRTNQVVLVTASPFNANCDFKVVIKWP